MHGERPLFRVTTTTLTSADNFEQPNPILKTGDHYKRMSQ